MEEEKKKNILSHIDKIEQYARMPGNEWLLHELQRRFGNSASNPDIQRIEKYLALDYTIDSVSERIDYSFVIDEVLRMKLVSDWREMLRYRCYVRKHKPDFMEFCRSCFRHAVTQNQALPSSLSSSCVSGSFSVRSRTDLC